ncbi:MAG TPA: hypothetical protein PK478_02040 [Nitrospira sp.]|nr:hypothetical protein [Nitrospira sp.]HQW88597.1 hypothetical protein [Nitrospira sp.]
MASNQQVQIRITAQNMSDPAFKDVARALDQISNKKVKAKVEADTAQAEASVDKLDKMIVRIGGQAVEIPVDADLNPALAEMARAEREVQKLDSLDPEIDVRADAGQAISEMNKLERGITSIGQQAQIGFGALRTQIVGVASGMAIATGAMALIGKGFGFVKDSIFGANNEMDQTRATLLAVTKSASETEKILGMINREAARTPYVFGEMASAYTSLLPLSKQYNLDLQALVESAELLAASKPEQGLAGAAFALREAMSGDYMSLISRFDLPRQYINQLKAEGVPALEIVNRAMGQMGFDADIMARRAETMSAKWATFFDDIRIGIATATAPAVQWLSTNLLSALTSVKESATAVIQGIGEVGTALASLPPISVLKVVLEEGGSDRVWSLMDSAFVSLPGVKAIRDGAELSKEYNDFNETGIDQSQRYVDTVNNMAGAYQKYIDAHAYDEAFIGNQAELSRQAEAYYFQIEQQEAALRRRQSAARDAAAEEATQDADRLRRQEEYLAATKGDRDMARLRDDNMDGELYASTLDAQAEAAFRAAEANSTLLITQDRLAEAYQTGLQAQQTYTAQGAEYASQANNITKAMEIIQQKQADGIELTEGEIFIRDHATAALDRYKGGQEDAAMTAGEYAVRNGMVMQAQDELNAALGRGEISQAEYAQKMKDAYAAAGLTYDATANNSTIMGTMASTIATELVPAILDLVRKLDEINGKHVTATVETNFITTGDSATGQMYGQHVSGGVVGVTANAAGGIIDRPMLSLVGEEAPAHPEYIIPTNPARRGRAVGLWAAAGRSLGVPGFADGGGPGAMASGGGSSPGPIDWSWLFAGMDAEAENYTDRVADAFAGLFRDIEDLATGAAAKRAQEELDRLVTIRQIAIDTGAGESVVAGLDAQITEQQGKVEAIGAAMGTAVVSGIAGEIASAATGQAITDAWQSALGSLDGILSGDYQEKLQGKLDNLQTQLRLALAGGAPDEVIDAIQQNIAAVSRELETAGTIFNEAVEAGLIPDAFTMPLDKIAELLPQMKDGGLSMIDEMARGIAEGTTDLGGVLDVIGQMIAADSDDYASTIGASAAAIVDQLNDVKQALLSDLAQALVDGSDPTAIQQNLMIIEQLLEDTETKVKRTSDELRNLVSGQIIKRPTGTSSEQDLGSVGGGLSGFGGGGGGRAVNLVMPSGQMVASWYAWESARDALLSPIGVG